MKVFITTKLPGKVENILRKKGFTVSVHKEDYHIDKKELIKKASGADALICLLTDKIDKEIIASLKKCKIIANVAVGFNNIDTAFASENKIIVTNTPGILTDATADLTMALLLAAGRRLAEGERIMRAGNFKGWAPGFLLGVELKDKILGIAGAGRIGTAVAKRGKAFGMKIIYADKNQNLFMEKELEAKKVSMENLLKISDFLSLHLPLTEETFHIINRKNLKLMKRSAVLINTSRGEIINEKDLIGILKQKKIFAAGLDVYENEPMINKELLKLENVVLLPHIGSATNETRTKMALMAAENVINVLNGKKAITHVNLIK